MYLITIILIYLSTIIVLEIFWYLLSMKVDKKRKAKNKIKIRLEKYKKFMNKYKRLPQVDSKSLKEQELAIWMKSIKSELAKPQNKKIVKEIQKMFNEFFSEN